jgi:NhaA family Na+:H+ antiporter
MSFESQESHSTFREFFRTEAAAGGLLVICAAGAVIAANSAWAEAYNAVWQVPLTIALGEHSLSLSIQQWINDGLMAVFFLVVGLEIKRETVAGELSTIRQAALPIAGAVGGMIVPASIYVIVNSNGLGTRGWAIPMATDIAFALGILALVVPRAPGGLQVFLAALAIVDDMGAVLVIALFYTRDLVWQAMAMAGIVMLTLVCLNLFRVRRLTPYLLLGVSLWFFVHESGVHATIAGVLLAFVIPRRTLIDAEEYSITARRLLDDFDRTETGDLLVLTSKGQQEAIVGLERASEDVMAPLLRLEHALHGFSAFVVMPLFALSNAGVSVTGTSGGPVMLGVALGLVIGKPLGIMAAAWAAVRLRIAILPSEVNWTALHGCAWLGGIGFTMSLFIATLAFDGTALLDMAKLGILGGSLVAAIVGTFILRSGIPANHS